MKERRIEGRWKAAGKGRGLRWQILRQILAMCTLSLWTTTELEDACLILLGLTHRKSYEMIQELERARCLKTGLIAGTQHWQTTEHGVALFLGKAQNIPATVASGVVTIRAVFDSEEDKKK